VFLAADRKLQSRGHFRRESEENQGGIERIEPLRRQQHQAESDPCRDRELDDPDGRQS
jgi:hypothetical protein